MTEKRLTQTDPPADSDERTMLASEEDSPSAGSARVGAEPTAPEEVLAEALRQRDEYYDRLLRKSAEFDNYRKRIERERRDLQDYAAASVLEDLLPVLDDLERALKTEATTAESQAYRDGVALIHRQLMELLRKRGASPIETVGQRFDPQFHQAVAHEYSDQHEEGEIVEEVRRGYMLKDRLLRPALVKVAKA